MHRECHLKQPSPTPLSWKLYVTSLVIRLFFAASSSIASIESNLMAMPLVWCAWKRHQEWGLWWEEIQASQWILPQWKWRNTRIFFLSTPRTFSSSRFIKVPPSNSTTRTSHATVAYLKLQGCGWSPRAPNCHWRENWPHGGGYFDDLH